MKVSSWILLAWVGYLGVSNGYLTIFQKEKPKTVLPYRVECYPQQDQNALTKGIPFHNEQELASLLEDFLS